MVSVMKPAKSSVPKSTQTELPFCSCFSFQRSFSNFKSKGTAASAASGATRRGHQSLTPKIPQPSWISQNSSGGLWL